MPGSVFEELLSEVRLAHSNVPALRDFCLFPDDLIATPQSPRHVPAADLMAQDRGFFADGLAPLRDAFVAAGPAARWRETYKGTAVGRDFMDRFGCYCLIGQGGPWTSSKMAGYVVYMPADLYYPWHQHPAEELYLVLAGEAEFMGENHATQVLEPGGHVFHASDQPHAMRTRDHPVMAYVLWRNHLDVPPVLTNRAVNG